LKSFPPHLLGRLADALQVGVLGLAVEEHGELEVTGFPLNLLLELNRRLEGAFGEGGMEEGQMVDQDVVQQRQIILAEAGEVFLGGCTPWEGNRRRSGR